MRHHIISVLTFFFAGGASAQSYLVEPSLTQCQARSAAQCSALHCDGVTTIYWWPCQPLASATTTGGSSGTGGTTALQILVGDAWFGIATSNRAGSGNLTVAEQAALQTEAQLADALPWIVRLAAWASRLSAGQLNAIANNPTVKAELTAIQAGSTVNLKSAAAQKLASDALSAGLIDQATYNNLLAWQATLSNP